MPAIAAAVLSGCGATIPADPSGTLERVRGGTLEVGVSINEPWTSWPPDREDPGGVEADLVREFAGRLDAEVTWHRGGEERLIGLLEEEQLDVVIGGLTSDSPWSEQVALTSGYTRSLGPDGSEQDQVMAAAQGENAFLTELESFLREYEHGR